MNKSLFFIVILSLLGLSSIGYTQKVEYSSLKLNSTIDDVVWCGSDTIKDEDDETIVLEGVETRITNIMYMLTNRGEVFVSNTHGEKWANMTGAITAQYKSQLDAPVNIRTIQVSPADSNTVFLFGTNGQSFAVQKCGKSVSLFKHDKTFNNFKLNKKDKKLLLAHKPTICKKFDDECEIDETALLVSKDMGKTFTKIQDNVYLGTWEKQATNEDIPDNRILVHHREKVKGKNNDKKMLTYSDDFYSSYKVIDMKVEHFYQSSDYLFVLTSSEQEDSYNLKVAAGIGHTNVLYNTRDLNLPMKRNKDHSFTILDSIKGSVFLGINHQGHSSAVTNIYYSDAIGNNYNLGLMNAVRNTEGNVDFEQVASSKGVYVANVYDNNELERIQSQGSSKKQEAKNSNQSQFSQGRRNGDKQMDFKQGQFNSLSSIKKSVISFNHGSTWHPIKAPAKNFNGEDLNCSGECSLHLAGRTSKIGEQILSPDNAHGIILATGNTGVYLEEKEENLNTYLSNDGGHSWKEIKQHPHYYAVSDRGGLIVLGKSIKKTNKIHYSWDQGNTWQYVQFAKHPVDIIDIQTEHSNTSLHFLVFAKRTTAIGKTTQQQGVVVSLNFESLHERECEGQWNAGDSDSDYEIWIPRNYQEGECILGQKVSYVRRRPNVQCFNPSRNDKFEMIEHCECTEEDFECEFGHYRNDDNECVPQSEKFAVPAEQKPPANCKDYYVIKTAYRKIPLSECKGGVDKGARRAECPPREPEEVQKTVVIEDQSQQQQGKQQQQQQQQQQNYFQKAGQNQQQQGFVEKYGLIIVLLVLLYVFREKVVELIEKAKSMVSKGNEASQGYGNLNSEGYKFDQENRGMMDDDDDEEQIQV